MYYKCDHFIIQELVPKLSYDTWGEKCWEFLDPQALRMIDGIWMHFGVPIYVNNWYWGGNSQYRGLRPPYVKKYANHSPHRFGKGFDLIIKGIKADDAREEIVSHKNSILLKYITRMEVNITWLHVDCNNVPDHERIVLFEP